MRSSAVILVTGAFLVAAISARSRRCFPSKERSAMLAPVLLLHRVGSFNHEHLREREGRIVQKLPQTKTQTKRYF